MKKPKKINFELIPPAEGHESYKLMADLRKKFHSHLSGATIGIAWRISLKPNVDGQLILGKCVKQSDLTREVAPYDFIILLNREVWQDPEFVREKKMALLDHELCHAEVSTDTDTGEIKVDDRGRTVWRIRKHDIEEFQAVIERHGCYKRDLEAFAKVLIEKQQAPLLAGIAESKQAVQKQVN